MKKTSIFLLLFMSAALLVWLAAAPDASRAADDSKFTIVYSSNLLGYTEPCG
jgi:ABC-type sugar transport system substrate-binding protein